MGHGREAYQGWDLMEEKVVTLKTQTLTLGVLLKGMSREYHDSV